MGGWWSSVGGWVGVGRTILAEFKQGGMKDSWGCHSLFMSQAASQRNGPLSSARVQCHSRLQQCALAQKLQSHPIPPHPNLRPQPPARLGIAAVVAHLLQPSEGHLRPHLRFEPRLIIQRQDSVQASSNLRMGRQDM